MTRAYLADAMCQLAKSISQSRWCQSSDATLIDGTPCDADHPMAVAFDVIAHADRLGLDDFEFARLARFIAGNSPRAPIAILRDWNDRAGMTKSEVVRVIRLCARAT